MVDDIFYCVIVGNYFGLYYGEIKEVYDNYIELLELIFDGVGCWKECLIKLEMLEVGINGVD